MIHEQWAKKVRNGFGNLRTNRYSDMEAFDGLPVELREFARSAPASLSIVHFSKRWKAWRAKGAAIPDFLKKEKQRLTRILRNFP